MIRFIQDNILKSDADIICQQVNCFGVMGAGLAKQIRAQYPEVYTSYRSVFNSYQDKSLLGKVNFVYTSGPIIANLFGQYAYGRTQLHTDYKALYAALCTVAKKCNKPGIRVAIPYGIGCGLAGGDWNIVQRAINKAFENFEGTVEIYKLKITNAIALGEGVENV